MFTSARAFCALVLFLTLTAVGGSGSSWATLAAPAAAIGPGEPSCQVFPPNNAWNTDVSGFPVHPQSDAYVNAIGRSGHLHPDFGTVWDGAPIGIPYAIVNGGQPKVPVSFGYADESDPGPYPIPPDAPIEGGADSGGDRHVIVIDQSACVLYEMFDAHPVNGGQSWNAGSGAVFDLNSNALRPDYWTSADAAGLPIFAGLARYSEVVERGVVNHALRFTVAETRRAFMHPATHYASGNTSPSLPPMGLRFRMKASYDCGGFSAEVQVICAALKRYGMIVADNGSDWFVSGAPDDRWNDDALGGLKQITGDAFEVVNTGEPIITESGPEYPPPAPPPAPPPPPAAPTQAPAAPPGGVPPALKVTTAAPPANAASGPESATPTEPAGSRTPTPKGTATDAPSGQTGGGDGGGSGDGSVAIGLVGFAALVLLAAGAGGFWYFKRQSND